LRWSDRNTFRVGVSDPVAARPLIWATLLSSRRRRYFWAGKPDGEPPKLEGGILQAFAKWVKFDYHVFFKTAAQLVVVLTGDPYSQQKRTWMHELVRDFGVGQSWAVKTNNGQMFGVLK
jgi:hypothetical protein